MMSCQGFSFHGNKKLIIAASQCACNPHGNVYVYTLDLIESIYANTFDRRNLKCFAYAINKTNVQNESSDNRYLAWSAT